MTAVYLTLLGPFQLQPPAKLRRKARALLAYLAANPPQTRPALMDIFCADAQAPNRALSVLLSRIRRALGPDAIITDAHGRISRHPDHLTTDLDRFTAVLATDPETANLNALETAVSLFRGDFLAGMALDDAPAFEMWLLNQRARTRQQYENGLLALVRRHRRQQRYDRALPYARDLAASNPLLEEAHAQLIWLYARLGRRDAALRQFDHCRRLLQTELAVDPSPALVALADAVRQGQMAPPAPPPAAAARPASARPDPFIGRDTQLRQLHAAWDQARQGHGQLILVDAEAGGGKSRLLHTFAAQTAPALRLAARCFESTHHLPLQPWLDLLETAVSPRTPAAIADLPAYIRRALSRLLPALAPAGSASAAADDDPTRLYTAVSDFLTRHLPAPLLLILDDVQWADDSTLHLLLHLARRLPRFPLLLLAACRSEDLANQPRLQTLAADLARSDAGRLSLPPFTPAEMADLLSHYWPELAPGYRRHVLQMMATATGGNALFLNELLAELAGGTDAPVSLPLPPSVRDLVRRRLQTFAAPQRQVIETLAVWDGPAALDQLRQISGRSEAETAQALEQGLAWRVLAATTGATAVSLRQYDFRHDLWREAVLAETGPSRARALHRRAAAWLARLAERHPPPVQQEMAARITLHARAGEDAARLFRWAPPAAAHARELGAYNEMMRLLDTAVAAYDHLPPDDDAAAARAGQLVDVLLDIVWYGWLVGREPDAEKNAIDRAAHLLACHPHPRRQAALRLLAANAPDVSFAKRLDISLDAYRQLLALEERPLAALALRQAAASAITISRNRDGRRWYAEALALSRASNDTVGVAAALDGLAWTALNLGEVATAIDSLEAALALNRERGNRAGEAAALFGLAAAWGFYHHAGKMAEYAAAAEALYIEIGYAGLVPRPRLYTGVAHMLRDETDDATAVLQTVAADAEALSDWWALGWAQQMLGRLALARSDVAAAAGWLHAARDTRLQTGAVQNQVNDLAWLGRLALSQGDTDAALAATEQAITQMAQFAGEFYVWEQPDVWLCRADVLEAAGLDATDALTRARAALQTFAAQIDDASTRAIYLAHKPHVAILRRLPADA